VRGQVQRRRPARQTEAGTRPAALTADSPQAQTAHPSSVRAFTSAPNATSNRMIRRLQNSAAKCSAVEPFPLRTAGPGCGGGPHGGNPVPNRYPNTKQQAGPEGRPFWVNVNGREYPERTQTTCQLAPRSRIHQTCQTSESRRNGDCRRRRRRETGRLGKTEGERTGHGTWRRDLPGGASARSIEIA
jgi:hypothetical protein